MWLGADGLKVDPDKVAAVMAWPQPQTVAEVRSFLGLATYFRRFIQGFSTLARPLHALTRNVHDRAAWNWDAACDAAFTGLKHALSTAPVLALPVWDKPFEMVTDASVHGTGAVLLQEGHPIAYESKRFSPAEYDYDTGEQELLGVVRALLAFRCYVEGQTFTLVTDHEPLTYLRDQPKVSRNHARWYGFLTTFTFKWEHRPGRINVADPLSRLPGVAGWTGVARLRHHLLCAVTRGRASAAAATPLKGKASDTTLSRSQTARDAAPLPPLLASISAAYGRDPWFADEDNLSHLTREREL
jgi:hypothetical protein